MHALNSLTKSTLRTLGLKPEKPKNGSKDGSAATLQEGGSGSWLSFDTQKTHTPLTSNDEAEGKNFSADDANKPRPELDSSSSVEQLLERIQLLEEKLDAEKTRADIYFVQLQEAVARADGAEHDLRIASVLHRTQMGSWMMRPFRLCFGGRNPTPEEQRFTSNNHGRGSSGGGHAPISRTSLDTI